MSAVRLTSLICALLLPLGALAGSIDVGSFVKPTGAAPVSQVISHNLGETPKLIFFWTATRDGEGFGSHSYISYGMTDGTTEYSFSSGSQHNVSTTNTSTRAAAKAVTVIEWGENLLAEASLTAWDSDDFTLNWTTNGFAFATRIHFIAMGGTDISAKVVSWDTSATTGNQSITGVGFEPDLVLHMWSPSISSIPSSVGRVDLGFGAMDSSGDEWAFSLYCPDGDGTSNTTHGQAVDACLYDSNYGSVLREAAFVSMDSDGFTINHSTAPGASRKAASLCISGVNAKAGSFSKTTSGAPVSQSVTGVLFEPELLILGSWGEPSNGLGDDGLMCFGATDGTTEGASAIMDLDGVGTTDVERVDKTSKVFILPDDAATNTIAAEADLTSFDTDGFTLNWTTNDSEATRICYLAVVPFAAIAVRLRSMRADALPSGVTVSWSSESEVDNVGFHVYREDNGKRVRVSRQLLPGSALTTKNGVTLSAGRAYKFIDASGGSGDRYWIEDYDSSGETRFHGPIVASVNSQSSAPAVTPVPLPVSATTTSGQYEPRVAPGPEFGNRAQHEKTLAFPGLKVNVEGEGLYRITQREWLKAGLDLPSDPRRLQLFFLGEEHAIQVSGEADGSFDPEDSVLFYGLGVDTPYTGTGVYWLVDANTPGRRIDTVTNAFRGTALQSSRATILDREESVYFAALRNGPADNFFGPILWGQTLERCLELPARDPMSSDPALVEVSLQGLTPGAHEIAVHVNGTLVGEVTLEGTSAGKAQFLVPPADSMVIQLTSSGMSDISLLEALRVDYQRLHQSTDGRARVTVPGGTTLALQGFSSTTTEIMDVTSFRAPMKLRLRPGSPGTVLVDVPGGTTRTIYACAHAGIRAPAALERIRALRKSQVPPQFVIVAPKPFLAPIKPLATKRRTEGLQVEVIDVADCYDEFSFGIKDPSALRARLRSEGTRWQMPPRYLLLVGDATYDPRNHLGGANVDHLPTRLVDTHNLETSSDSWYGDLDGDGWPEVAVGRFPAADVSEVEHLVNKTLAYETQANPPAHAVLVSDNDDRFPFARSALNAVDLLPKATVTQIIDLNESTIVDATQQLLGGLNQGPDLVAYFGHGGSGTWAAEGLLDTTAASSLTNSTNLFVVVNMSCLNGYFHRVDGDCLAEAFLKAPAGGAVAVWASSSLTNPYAQRELMYGVIDRVSNLSSASPPRLGDVFLGALSSRSDALTRKTIQLLGDPTVVFRW